MYEIYSFVIKSTTNDFVLVLLTQAFVSPSRYQWGHFHFSVVHRYQKATFFERFLDFLLNFYLNFINFHFEQPIKKLTIKFSRVIFEKIWSCLYHTHAT